MPLTLVGTVLERPVALDLDKPETTIGRASTCALQIPDPSVSREHARISVNGDDVHIADLGSRNGTWVNGNRIEGDVPLTGGDRVEIGGVRFEIRSPNPADNTILANDMTMASSSAVNWKEIYESASTGTEQAYRKLDLFQVLAEAGELLTDDSPLGQLSEMILDLVDKAVSAERIMVLLREEGHDEPVVRASRTKISDDTSTRIMLSRTMVDKVMEERTSFLTLDAMHDPRFEAQESIILQGTRSAMAAPLFDNEHVIGVLYADSTDPLTRYTRDELRTFTILANLIGVKITQARLAAAEEEKRTLELQMQTAKEIMTRILPSHIVSPEGYQICAFQEPSHAVGGDLYDARPLADGRVWIMMGDVSGKGIGAALLVSNVLASTRLLVEDIVSPLELVTRLNRHVFRSTDPMHFVTLFFGVLDPVTGEMEYVNAGHNPPLLVGPDGGTTEIDATGIPVGTLEEFPFTAGEATLDPGGSLLLYSDGIPEAELSDDVDFGMDRLHTIVSRESERGAEAIVAAIRKEVQEFLGETPIGDDVTLLCVHRTGATRREIPRDQ